MVHFWKFHLKKYVFFVIDVLTLKQGPFSVKAQKILEKVRNTRSFEK